MSAGLPTADNCCLPSCDEVVTQNIPGPTGSNGTDGEDGTDGISAVTTLTVAFTMPAELASDTATMATTDGLVIGENVYVQSLGTLQVTAITSSVQATLKNVEDAATSAYDENAAPGTIAPVGSRVGPTGLQGPEGLLAGAAAGGDLKGNYPDPKLLIPNALGALVVGNGTDATSLSPGTNGQIPAYDNTQPVGLIPKSIIPVTGATNAAADQLVRLSSATGTPIALSVSKASIKDPGGAGALVVDATSGNARGTDAVDLQSNRTVVGATAVASGSRSVIGGGQDNIASGAQSVVAGGNGNANSALEAVIGGGASNIVDSTQSTIAGGDGNQITGGAATECFIGGGFRNKITGLALAVIAGGNANTITSRYGVILGGAANIVTGTAGVCVGGINGTADKYGQRVFSSGGFSSQADCQQSDLIWRVSTTDATANVEAYLDGASASQRATVPSGSTWAFDILVSARSSAGVSAAWTVRGAIQNNGGTTALVAAVTTTVIADGTGGTWGLAANVTVDADNGNDALRIRVTGAAATTIRWGIHGRIMEVAT